MAEFLLQEQHLLPANATVPEKALAGLGVLLDKLDDPIATMWDPWTVPVEALAFLAWALRVPLWDAAWPETKKRAVIAESPDLNAAKGSFHALARYVEIMGGKTVSIAAPPQGIYPEAGWSEAERRAWLAGFPEIRLYDNFGPEQGPPGMAEAGGYLPDAPESETEAFWLDPYEPKPVRRALLIGRSGEETELEVLETRTHQPSGATHVEETFFLRVASSGGFHLDVSFLPDALDPPEPIAFLPLTDGVPRAPLNSPLISNRPERIVATGFAQEFFPAEDAVGMTRPPNIAAEDAWSGEAGGFLMENAAHRLIYDSFRLFDGDAGAVALPAAGYCLGDPDLIALEPCHLLVDVDASFRLPGDASFSGAAIGGYLDPDDGAWRKRLFAALAAANPTSDRTLASTALHRPAHFSDGLPLGSYRFGDLVPKMNPQQGKTHA